MPEDTLLPRDRRVLFHRGFGDGAKGSNPKLPDYSDYMAGYRRGGQVCAEETDAWCTEQVIAIDRVRSILREADSPEESPKEGVADVV